MAKQNKQIERDPMGPVDHGECLLAELLGLYRQCDDLEQLANGDDLEAAAARLRIRVLRGEIRTARQKIANYVTQEARSEKSTA